MILEKIIEVSNILDEIDDFESSISSEMSNYNYKLSDLYHYVENNTMDTKKCYRLCRELKKVLEERRQFKNNVELFHEYKNNIQKLNNGKENRQLLLSAIGKRSKQLNQPYKNRVYAEEELKEIMEG